MVCELPDSVLIMSALAYSDTLPDTVLIVSALVYSDISNASQRMPIPGAVDAADRCYAN